MRLSGERVVLRTLAFGLLVFLAFVSLSPRQSVVAATVDSEVLDVKPQSGGGVRAVAHVIFPAGPALIQSMLTDYAHWPELFEVRMRLESLKIQGDVATTDIRIEHALLPGERRLVTESRTLPGGGLVTDLVGGDFKKYHRVWKFTPRNGGAETSADFELLVAIDSIVPDWLVALAMRRELEAHFRIVKEKAIERSKQGR
jgi:Polyketide cyclase / dehydrase and lipid transport